jgi:hypothetical protein
MWLTLVSLYSLLSAVKEQVSDEEVAKDGENIPKPS